MATIGVCLKAGNNPFWSVEVQQGLRQEAQRQAGFRLLYRTPEHISDIRKQKEILRDFVEQKVDGIILAPSHPRALSEEIQMLDAAGIPLLVIDTNVELEANYTFLGFDDFQGGRQTALHLRSHLQRGDKVAIIQGSPEGTVTERVRGFVEGLEGDGVLLPIITAYFEEDLAYVEALGLLRREPSLRAIFCTSDNMALGALAAMHEAERHDVLLCGFDATGAGRLALERGKLLSTVDTRPQELGERAVSMMARICAGEKVASERYEVELLTSDTVLQEPKTAVLKREYLLVEVQKDCSEYPYHELATRKECPVVLGGAMTEYLPQRLKALEADRYYIVTDSTVRDLYAEKLEATLHDAGLETALFTIPAGEHHKTFTTLGELAMRILHHGVSKQTCLVLVGGGVVGNLAGLLAALLMRGLRFVHVPTTVMSQIDSTTGGKQAVNMPQGKNLLGTYHEPEMIYIDPTVIETLSPREYRSGIAEAVKHGLCQSQELLELIQKGEYLPIVRKTIEMKTRLIHKDPRELGEGLILVYGHTVGHAIETVSHHAYTHGEAISMGMMVAARLSVKMGFAKENLVETHRRYLEGQGLPTELPANMDREAIIRTLAYDKKGTQRQLSFVLLNDVASIQKWEGGYLVPVKEGVLREVMI